MDYMEGRMRLLKDLIQNASTVWIYCESEALQKHFLKQAETEGFRAINGQKPTELFKHQLYGINDDMTVGYLSAMIWSLTFQTGSDEHIRIDYGKYISDCDNFYCDSVKLKKVNYSDWNLIAYSNGLDTLSFEKLCSSFIEGQSFEEYSAYVYRSLIESSWNYSPDKAVERMQDEDYYIVECYINKISASACASEVGFGCG